MAPAVALGEGEWEGHGGTVVKCKHPSGRVTFTYVSPKGDKFRSWKQCLTYIEEGCSGSSPREDKKPPSSSKRPSLSNAGSPTPRAIKKQNGVVKRTLCGSGKAVAFENSSREDDEDFNQGSRQPEDKKKPKDFLPKTIPAATTSPSSPDTTAGRHQNLLELPSNRKVISPSTFTAADMPGRNRPRSESAKLMTSPLVVFSDPSSDEGPMETKIGRKTKSDRRRKCALKEGSSGKGPLSDTIRKRMRLRWASAVVDPKLPTSALVSEVSEPPTIESNGISPCDEVIASNGSAHEEHDAWLHFGKANGRLENANVTSPLAHSESRIEVVQAGRKRAHESSADATGSLKKKKEDSDSDCCSSGSDVNEKDTIHREASNRPRRAAAGTNFKEKRIRLDEENARIDVKEDYTAESEGVAIVVTAQPGEEPPPQRKLFNFAIHDEDGTQRPIECIELCHLYITGLVLPNIGILDKDRGVRCVSFGPLISWSIMGYERFHPTLVLCTELAEYYCDKPAGVYKKLYHILYDKAKVCVEVYKGLSKPEGGDPNLQLDELIARVSRSFSKQGGSGLFFNREYMINHGEFIAAQLNALDEHAGDKEQLFSGLPAIVSLGLEGSKLNSSSFDPAFAASNGALTIREGGSGANGGASGGADSMSDSMHEDEKLARLLQEEADRASSRSIRRAPTSKGKYYIKINETEIANDYPLPAYYKAEEQEMDEYLLFDELVVDNPEDLPHRKLHDWTLYNSDSRLISLELLPMLPGAETDMEIFGSGVVTEDDGSGFYLDSEAAEDERKGVAASNGNASSEQEFRVYLSAVKEWKIEFGASMLFISFRTDGAWYRLGKPSQQYEDWYKPVFKTAQVAVKIITMLKDELRVNRLSLNDVIKKLADQKKDEPTYISAKTVDVERYVIVHGQIILQQFAEYPDEKIKKSAFITGLGTRMEQVSHTKLTLTKKKLLKKERNLNPRANVCPDGNKRKPMRATTTRLVDRIWSTYYAGAGEAEEAIAATVEKDAEVVEEELLEESDDEEIVFETKPSQRGTPKKKSKYWKAAEGDVKWVDQSTTRTVNNETVFMKAIFRGAELTAGKAVLVTLDEGNENLECPPVILLIEYLFQTRKDGPMIHGRVLQRGTETVLGNAANEREVFLTDACEDIEIEKIKAPVSVEMRQRNWGYDYRKENADKDEVDRVAALEREKKGLPQEYFCRSWYSPERGAFFSLPKDNLALGTGTCDACETRRKTDEKLEVHICTKDEGFRFQGIEYHINDYLYLDPDTFEREIDSPVEKVLFKGGRNKGLRAFAICQLLNVLHNGNGKKASRLMKVRRFYRPEDVDKLKAYKAHIHEVYYSEETSIVDIATARGKCVVRRQVHEVAASEKCAVNHVFFCGCIHDPKTGTVKQLPLSIKLSPGTSLEETTGKSQAEEIAARAKGKGKAIEDKPIVENSSESRLSTLDIFAGCGGLSEGLHQSGVTVTKWAIEYDHPAAEAFKLNHPTADVFCENCNVVLRSIMEIGGDLNDCVSTPEAKELSLKLEGEKKRLLPKPGEVDFISGGPPCQGFSGMNRFNQRAWSKVQCEMILSFLSYAEYFRPHYFLLENVRNFVSFNKGQTFRLSLASLLEMGYQVRFGVLQAGNYGVAQSRKRAFIWAAAPNEILPEWPEPRHVFSSSQLGVALPGGFQYAAVRDAGRGAPLRPITVRDTLGDLPAVENGANKADVSYTNPSESWFQAQIRGEESHLVDHIAKEMNELNLIRCQRIPKEPGADWRNLPDEKVKLSTGQVVDLIPWCLPNTAARHNQWKGLYGRLDWDGNFPTSITDPQPMGKVGMCFHPEQDRIVTVRECARSQGFPDAYKFFGNINHKHRQIGNAVPPPLARALGHMLKEAVKGRKT